MTDQMQFAYLGHISELWRSPIPADAGIAASTPVPVKSSEHMTPLWDKKAPFCISSSASLVNYVTASFRTKNIAPPSLVHLSLYC